MNSAEYSGTKRKRTTTAGRPAVGLIDKPDFVAAYTGALNHLHNGGARAALEALSARP
ncbi:hypothetical protein [Arthrobacter sp. 92]|uniref:hypothetical protein n=1 Tax=Arthrobacter sp. 92 TaxID=3418175 RepID=UPI003D040B04